MPMSLQETYCQLNNLNFPADYFEDEVRDGFLITSMMKRYWASQLKVLSEVARVCEKHNIRWFADCGTLIGAVRHEGYVPWDDDLDICMLRSDWLKFFSIAEKELPEGYQILNLSKEEEYQEIIGRVVNSHAIDYGVGHLKEFFSCPYTVGIDIFPLDAVYDDKDREEDRRKRANKVLKALEELEKETPDEHYLKGLLRDIEKENGRDISFDRNVIRNLTLLAEELYMECRDEDTRSVALMPFYVPAGNHVYERDLFENTVKLPFEITLINAPARYEEVLDLEYSDFMKIVKNGGLHDYPVYRDQELILAKHMGHNPYRYTFDIKALLGSVSRYTKKVIEGSSKREKRNILFLPVKSKWWESMEELYLAAKADPDNNVMVMPIPWYECDTLGNVGVMHDDSAAFPGELHCISYNEFEFGSQTLDAIVVQVPFDGWSMAMSVPEFFYSDNLLGLTDELVYIPYFDAADPEGEEDKAEASLSCLIEQPVVVSADKVVLKSEKMRQLYISKLIAMSGEETRNYWENKVVMMDKLSWCRESEGTTGAKDSFAEDGDTWNLLVGDTGDNKVVIYYITLGMLLKGREKAIDKIKRALDTFGEADGITTVVLPQREITAELDRIDQGLWEEFNEVMKSLLPDKKNCVYDEKGVALSYINKWDAFYGDRGSVPLWCMERGIPVMIENPDV